MTGNLPFFAIFLIGGLVVPLVRGKTRNIIFIAVPIISIIMVTLLNSGAEIRISAVGLDLIIQKQDKLSLLFAYVFHIAAILAAIYSWTERSVVHHSASLIYIGSAIGAVFSGDLITLFVFWEIMALSSVCLIWARNTTASRRAGARYLLIQIISGLFLLCGAVVHYTQTGSIEIVEMELGSLAANLLFVSFGIKCAFPLLHNWLTDAYPESTPAGTVLLSALTTKVAVYILARQFAGTEVLIYIGMIMTCFPIFYAVIENDLRRVLAYSMINQIGFMVCGIGIGTELAINGAVAHAFNDVIFKGLLMMSMGAVLYRTGKMDGSDLGGLWRSMPKTAVLCIVGAASISAFPLFSGFVSKSMVMTAAIKEGHLAVWIGLLFASAGVFHHAGIKIPFFAFFAHDSGIRVEEAPRSMLVAMSIAAALCIGIGVFPQYLYALLPYSLDYTPYDVAHVGAQIQLLLFSALAFVWLKLSGIYPPELKGTNIDAEWVYRKALPAVSNRLTVLVGWCVTGAYSLLLSSTQNFTQFVVRYTGESSRLSRSWTVNLMVFTFMLLFGLLLIILFINS